MVWTSDINVSTSISCWSSSRRQTKLAVPYVQTGAFNARPISGIITWLFYCTCTLFQMRNNIFRYVFHFQEVYPNSSHWFDTAKVRPQDEILQLGETQDAPQQAPPIIPSGYDVGGKAGIVAYPVLVGEASNLYKTSKSAASKSLVMLDLHGCSKEEALEKLNNNPQLWVDTAMKCAYPWVIPFDIIRGGGSQILPEVVRDWIKSNPQVANRPTGFAWTFESLWFLRDVTFKNCILGQEFIELAGLSLALKRQLAIRCYAWYVNLHKFISKLQKLFLFISKSKENKTEPQAATSNVGGKACLICIWYHFIEVCIPW